MLLGGLTRDRDFLKLWSGQAISKIGSTITSVGIPLTATFVLGASPLQMGFLAGSSGVGVLVFGLLAGAWATACAAAPSSSPPISPAPSCWEPFHSPPRCTA